ncbi:MAG: hypothetical protein MMC33_005046 [Icmadophila ericetorum]|nr:hypothetical protein [Icmadophila ericetorum]
MGELRPPYLFGEEDVNTNICRRVGLDTPDPTPVIQCECAKFILQAMRMIKEHKRDYQEAWDKAQNESQIRDGCQTITKQEQARRKVFKIYICPKCNTKYCHHFEIYGIGLYLEIHAAGNDMRKKFVTLDAKSRNPAPLGTATGHGNASREHGEVIVRSSR